MVGHEQDGLRHPAEVRGAHRVHRDLRDGLGQDARARSDSDGQLEGGERLPHLQIVQTHPEVAGGDGKRRIHFRSLRLSRACHESFAGKIKVFKTYFP